MAYGDPMSDKAVKAAWTGVVLVAFIAGVTVPVSIAVYMYSPTAREEAHKFPPVAPCCAEPKP